MDGLKELHPTPEFQDECDAKEYPSKSNSDQAISSDQGPAGRQPSFNSWPWRQPP